MSKNLKKIINLHQSIQGVFLRNKDNQLSSAEGDLLTILQTLPSDQIKDQMER